MAQFRHRHRIVDFTGTSVEGLSDLAPPPSLLKLVQQDQSADAQWKKWLNNLYEYIGTLTDQVNQVFITPASITVNAGGTPVGDVTGVTELNDGSVYQVPEVAATPGFDIDFNFTGVREISGFVSMIRYTGLATHVVEQSLHNYTDVQDDSFMLIPHTASAYQYRTVLIPDDTKYINSSDQAILSLIHTSAGNPSHDIYIDYIALIGKTT